MMDLDAAYSARCYMCKYHGSNDADSKCKRWIYPSTLIPAKAYFSCDDTGSMKRPCCEFQPEPTWKEAYENYTTFADYVDAMTELYKQEHPKSKLLYPDDLRVGVCVNGDRDVRYVVPLTDYWYGFEIINNKLQYSSKYYMKQCRDGFGYKLVTEGAGEISL